MSNIPAVEAVVEAERGIRAALAAAGRAFAYPMYKSGPVIASGTMGEGGYHSYDDAGLRMAIKDAVLHSRRDSLLWVAARRTGPDSDAIVCGFYRGLFVDAETCRIAAANGYTETAEAALRKLAEAAGAEGGV